MTRLWKHSFLNHNPRLAGTSRRKDLNGATKLSWTASVALAFKAEGKLSLRSRNNNDFALRCLSILACAPGLQAVDEPQILAHRLPLL
jgi:hypothetical protein